MLSLLGPLIADELAGLIPADPCNICDEVDLLSREGKQVERSFVVLQDP